MFLLSSKRNENKLLGQTFPRTPFRLIIGFYLLQDRVSSIETYSFLITTVSILSSYFFVLGLTVLSFYLPPDSGERLSLVITNLLAMTVFMLLVAEIIPPTSDAVSIISTFYSCCIFEVCFPTSAIFYFWQFSTESMKAKRHNRQTSTHGRHLSHGYFSISIKGTSVNRLMTDALVFEREAKRPGRNSFPFNSFFRN